MENYKLTIAILAVSFCSGCAVNTPATSSNKIQAHNNVKKDEVSTGIHNEKPDSAEMQTLKNQSVDVVKNHEQISAKSEKFIESQQGAECLNCTDAAIMSSASHYIAQRTDKAQEWANRAFELAPDNKLPFLPDSDLIATDDSIENQTKVAKAKDFIISCRNNGTEDFKQGNINFLGTAKYDTAIAFYKNALQKGLGESTIRQECYIHLAICLYHTNQFTASRKLILYAFLTNPNMVIDAGEQATRDALQSYIDEYKGRM